MIDAIIEEKLFELEKKAILLDRESILLIVSGFRTLRREINRLLEERHADGENDAVQLSNFEDHICECLEDLVS